MSLASPAFGAHSPRSWNRFYLFPASPKICQSVSRVDRRLRHLLTGAEVQGLCQRLLDILLGGLPTTDFIDTLRSLLNSTDDQVSSYISAVTSEADMLPGILRSFEVFRSPTD